MPRRKKEEALAGIPTGYREMLHEIDVPVEPQAKKRRIRGAIVTAGPKASSVGEVSDQSHPESYAPVEESSDSEVAWEDVGQQVQEERPDQELDLTLAEAPISRKRSPRKGLDAKEKKLRLDVHKMHVCCLIMHAFIRNHWCNCPEVQAALRPIVDSKTNSYLHPSKNFSQFQQSRSFMDGLARISDSFRGKFVINARGLSKARWARTKGIVKDPPRDIDLPYFKEDFLAAAVSRTGSRDIGAQLFCAFLRSLDLDTRLVCSLQPLPFRSSDQEAPKPKYADLVEKAPGKSLEIRESRYPVFWVEVLNPVVNKWIALDPLVTRTIAKPSKFEPPASERTNNMTYVLAFDQTGHIVDVTPRYTKAFNAKTRRHRVEITDQGDAWWRALLSRFARPHPLECDAVEEQELGARLASEPMPRNIQDFKGHPYYILERHLRRNEILDPRRRIGTVKIGQEDRAEPVFRRKDVKSLQTSVKWWRQGRTIKPSQIPLKRYAHGDDEGEVHVCLYSFDQTDLYRPAPVKDGVIPKNAHGNIDIYVPSMIPSGAVHLRHPLSAKAARFLDIDFAVAVTGFTFRARRGLPVMTGIVVAQERAADIMNHCETLDTQAKSKAEEEKSAATADLWLKFLRLLRIRKRIGITDDALITPESQDRDTSSKRDEVSVNPWSSIVIPAIESRTLLSLDRSESHFHRQPFEPSSIADHASKTAGDFDEQQYAELITGKRDPSEQGNANSNIIEKDEPFAMHRSLAEEASSESSAGSLLSHDPEEDADEPDWVQ